MNIMEALLFILITIIFILLIVLCIVIVNIRVTLKDVDRRVFNVYKQTNDIFVYVGGNYEITKRIDTNSNTIKTELDCISRYGIARVSKITNILNKVNNAVNKKQSKAKNSLKNAEQDNLPVVPKKRGRKPKTAIKSNAINESHIKDDKLNEF